MTTLEEEEAGGKIDQAKEHAESLRHTIKEKAIEDKENAKDFKDKAKDKIGDKTDQAKEHAESLKHKIKEKAHEAKEYIKDKTGS